MNLGLYFSRPTTSCVNSYASGRGKALCPDRGEILHDFDDGSWRLQRIDGTLIKEGREP